jgi:hypothetical protein
MMPAKASTESEGVDLQEYWEALGYHVVEPPADCGAVRLALANLLEVVGQFARLLHHECEPFLSAEGEPALQRAVATLLSWWNSGAHVLPIASIDWTDVERLVATLDFVALTRGELARFCCLVAAVRKIDDAIGWLRGKPEWAGVITYPGSVQVPESTWLYTDGDAGEAWIHDLEAQLQRYVGRKAHSDRWLKARLLNDDGDRRGQLPALLACAWLAGKKRPGQRAA